MFLSFYSAHYLAGDDVGLKQYITDLTATSSGNEFEWLTQAAMVEKYLQKAGVVGEMKYGIDLNTGRGLLTPASLKAKLVNGPVIIGTNKMCGLPGGHIILGIDNGSADELVVCNDPYGDARTMYKDVYGEDVIYHVSMFDHDNPTGLIRGMWLE